MQNTRLIFPSNLSVKFQLHMSGDPGAGASGSDGSRQHKYKAELSMWSSSRRRVRDPSKRWEQVTEVLNLTATGAQDFMLCKPRKGWVSSISVPLLDALRSLPPDANNMAYKYLRRELISSLKNDGRRWWIVKCRAPSENG